MSAQTVVARGATLWPCAAGANAMPEPVDDVRARLQRLGVPARWLDDLSDAAVHDLCAGLDSATGMVALPETVLRQLRAGRRSTATRHTSGPRP